MRAVIFDLDGTLIDSLPDVVGSLNSVLADAGRRPVTIAEGRSMVGGGAEPLIDQAFRATGDPARPDDIATYVDRFLAVYRERPSQDTVVYDGVRDALERLAGEGVSLGICTNKPHEMALRVLDALDLSAYFNDCTGKGVLPFSKPDRRHYDHVVEQMGVQAAQTVYIGDSETDVATARNAGVPVILVSFGYSRAPVETLAADRVIDRFADLPAALAEL